RNRREVLCGRYLPSMVIRRVVTHLGSAAADGVQNLESRHQFPARVHFDVQPAAGSTANAAGQVYGSGPEAGQPRRPGCDEIPGKAFAEAFLRTTRAGGLVPARGNTRGESQPADELPSFHGLAFEYLWAVRKPGASVEWREAVA